MPKTDLLFHPDAAEEYVQALIWYSDRGPGLGEAFEQEVERAIRLIAKSPYRWPRYGSRHRRFLIRRFPYQVVYPGRGLRFGLSPSRTVVGNRGFGASDT